MLVESGVVRKGSSPLANTGLRHTAGVHYHGATAKPGHGLELSPWGCTYRMPASLDRGHVKLQPNTLRGVCQWHVSLPYRVLRLSGLLKQSPP